MRSVMAVSAIAVQPVSPIARPRPVKADEQPMDQEDIFCPRFVDLDNWEKISQWYDAGNSTCQSCRKKRMCAQKKREHYG